MDWQILSTYQLGYVTAPLQGDERFAGMLSIPYLTPAGVRSLKFRRLSGNGAKYAQPEGQKARLYNTAAYFAAVDVIGICEGEIDAIAATERLGVPCVGVPGVDHWQANAPYWTPVFKDFGKVLVFSDGDPEMCQCSPRCEAECVKPVRPGEQLAKRIAQTLGWRAQIIYCPEGQDVASMIALGEAAKLTDQIRIDGDD
jgi:hypothetical protein